VFLANIVAGGIGLNLTAATQVVSRDRHAAFLAAIARLSDDASRSLRVQVDGSPYASLGLALLGGFVLGRGLTSRVGTFVLAAAGRAMLANLIHPKRRGRSEAPGEQ
jgi:hypothetical protein